MTSTITLTAEEVGGAVQEAARKRGFRPKDASVRFAVKVTLDRGQAVDADLHSASIDVEPAAADEPQLFAHIDRACLIAAGVEIERLRAYIGHALRIEPIRHEVAQAWLKDCGKLADEAARLIALGTERANPKATDG